MPEKERVTFECQLNKPDLKVTWYKDSQELTPSDRVEITVDGTWHRLTIKDTTVDDEDDYQIIIGSEASKAPLWVEGETIVKRQNAGWKMAWDSTYNMHGHHNDF